MSGKTLVKVLYRLYIAAVSSLLSMDTSATKPWTYSFNSFGKWPKDWNACFCSLSHVSSCVFFLVALLMSAADIQSFWGKIWGEIKYDPWYIYFTIMDRQQGFVHEEGAVEAAMEGIIVMHLLSTIFIIIAALEGSMPAWRMMNFLF